VKQRQAVSNRLEGVSASRSLLRKEWHRRRLVGRSASFNGGIFASGLESLPRKAGEENSKIGDRQLLFHQGAFNGKPQEITDQPLVGQLSQLLMNDWDNRLH
jgi:hypothetical protein